MVLDVDTISVSFNFCALMKREACFCSVALRVELLEPSLAGLTSVRFYLDAITDPRRCR